MSYKKRDTQCGVPAERHVGLEREDAVSNPNPGNPYVDAHLARRAKSQDLLYPIRGFGDGGDIPGVNNTPMPPTLEPPAR